MIEPTAKLLELQIGEASVPARVWEGATGDGIPVVLFVTRISPMVDKDDPANASVLEQFAQALKEVRAPSVEVQSWPLRLIL